MSTVPKLTEEREKLRELVPETIKESDDTEENNKTVQNIINNSSEARNDGLGHLQKLHKDLKSARNLEEKSDGKKGDKNTVVEETRLLTPDQGDIGQFTVQMFEDIRNSYIKSKYGIQMDNE